MQAFTIAGHTIQISGEGLNSLPGFEFFSETNTKTLIGFQTPLGYTNREPLLKIQTESILLDSDIPPVFTSEYENKSYDLIIKDDETWLFRMNQPGSDKLIAEIRRESNGFQATIHQTGFFDNISLSFVCWLLFGVAALSLQTVSIHSSVVMHRGKSLLFLGESGTGKSTHTRLWLNNIPDAELLNDDSPFIRIEADGSIRVYGSPWSGKTPCYKNMHTPVAAFIRLSQAPCNRIRRLIGIEAIAALLPSCPFAFAYDKRLSESIYAILSHTLLQTPVYYLECLPDTGAAQLVYSTLKQNNHL